MRALSTLILFGLLLSAQSAFADDWERISDEDGIKVWRKEVEGSDFVAFRGRGVVAGSLRDVAAVIRDANRETEWMADCVAAGVVKFANALDAYVYHRVGSPAFFVSDRDVVLFSKVEVVPEKSVIWVRFSNVVLPTHPPIDGAVRMPKLVGHWKLTGLGQQRTRVEYQVLADPGGALPAWLVNLVSKSLPYQTLMGLRKQLRAGGYEQHQMIIDVAIDWSQFDEKVRPRMDVESPGPKIGPAQEPKAASRPAGPTIGPAPVKE